MNGKGLALATSGERKWADLAPIVKRRARAAYVLDRAYFRDALVRSESPSDHPCPALLIIHCVTQSNFVDDVPV